MKRIIRNTAFSMVAMYLIMSFYEWNLNPDTWQVGSRLAVIVLGIAALCLTSFFTELNKK